MREGTSFFFVFSFLQAMPFVILCIRLYSSLYFMYVLFLKKIFWSLTNQTTLFNSIDVSNLGINHAITFHLSFSLFIQVSCPKQVIDSSYCPKNGNDSFLNSSINVKNPY